MDNEITITIFGCDIVIVNPTQEFLDSLDEGMLPEKNIIIGDSIRPVD